MLLQVNYLCYYKFINIFFFVNIEKLKILWHQKLIDYTKEEDELKIMLSKAEAEKHEKREIEIQKILIAWDQILFGPDFRSLDNIIIDNLHTFLDIR